MRRVRVVAALVREGERVLVSQRKPGGPRGDQWEFPGGKVEPGESEPAALARELAEELGVVAEVGPLFARVSHAYADLEVELAMYECRIVPGSGEPRALGSQQVRWVDRRALAGMDFCEADLPLLARLRDG